ncbi:hypothetical protein BGZ67_006523 [Mortierella alpina]|nr:hypothetical protein BGZ67_006523 [Mortierella alpina]
METSATTLPPRMRLGNLKSSADFPSEEYNHSIKTWVNMASLLVKQGNMAESNKDDENAYVSYVRACLFVTKIIPQQPQYPNMMNDIVCIDLRQKILGIISRMGHIERRLLQRYEQENQETAARVARGEVATALSPGSTPATLPTVSIAAAVETSASSRATTSLAASTTPTHSSNLKVELAPEEDYLEVEEDSEDDDDLEQSPAQRSSFRQDEDNESDQNHGSDEGEELQELELQLGVPTNLQHDEVDSSSELSPSIYTSQHHPNRRAVMFSRARSASANPYQQQQPHMTAFGDNTMKNHIRSTSSNESLSGPLRKKSSNDDGRSLPLSSPESQPNYSAMPSALFARQREGCHVRRCSSTDTLRTSVHFPTSSSSYAPAIPPRSDKRCSMIASMDRSSTSLLRSTVPDYRGTAASGAGGWGSGALASGTVPRTGYERDTFQRRFANRRTMSFESSYFKPMLLAESSASHSPSTSISNSIYSGSKTISRTAPSHLRKSSSISKINTSRNFVADLPPINRSTSFERKAINPMGSSPVVSAISPPSSSGASARSMNISTPFASPDMKSSPWMRAGSSDDSHNLSRQPGYGHRYSQSMNSNVSESTVTAVEPMSFSSLPPPLKTSTSANSINASASPSTPSPSSTMSSSLSSPALSPSAPSPSSKQTQTSRSKHRPTSSISSSVTYAQSTISATTSSFSCSSPSPTMSCASTWSQSSTAVVGKTAGLLRKIRSRPKVKDQLFEIVANGPSPALSSAVLPLSSPPQTQQQRHQFSGSSTVTMSMPTTRPVS